MPSKIAQYRTSAGLTIRQLAEKSHVSFSKISDYEQGRTIPRSDTLRRIADALGCTMDELWPKNEEEKR